MNKPTPGPWEPTRYGNTHWEVRGGDSQSCFQVAKVNGALTPGTSRRDGEDVVVERPLPGEANARLIAAAPDLVAALAWTLGAMTQGSPRVPAHRCDTSATCEFCEGFAAARAALAKAVRDPTGDTP